MVYIYIRLFVGTIPIRFIHRAYFILNGLATCRNSPAECITSPWKVPGKQCVQTSVAASDPALARFASSCAHAAAKAVSTGTVLCGTGLAPGEDHEKSILSNSLEPFGCFEFSIRTISGTTPPW
ncbi:hypothetical protein Vretifemale_18585, partial [Volvox reticuliferus]